MNSSQKENKNLVNFYLQHVCGFLVLLLPNVIDYTLQNNSIKKNRLSYYCFTLGSGNTKIPNFEPTLDNLAQIYQILERL